MGSESFLSTVEASTPCFRTRICINHRNSMLLSRLESESCGQLSGKPSEGYVDPQGHQKGTRGKQNRSMSLSPEVYHHSGAALRFL